MLLHSQLMDELTEWQALCNGDVSYKYRCMDIRSQSQRDLIQHWETELKKMSVINATQSTQTLAHCL